MTAAEVVERVKRAMPEAAVEVVENPSPSAQHSMLVGREVAVRVAEFLRDDSELRLDFCSNVTGIDWLERGYLEAVYHLYSVAKRLGPVVLRMRTADREAGAVLPSLTPVWKAAEFQEREIFDLFGIRFEGHPNLRRLLMWEEFEGHPMRRDYVEAEEFPAGFVIPGVLGREEQ